MKVMPNTVLGHWIWWAMAGIVGLVVFSAIVVKPFGAGEKLDLWARNQQRSGEFTPFSKKQAPGVQMPLLEVEEADYLRNYQNGQQRLLNHYSWSDKAQGKVRVPISRAMELVLQEKLPARQ